MLDFPQPYPDGSIRFHVLPTGRTERPADLPGSADSATQAKNVRFADRFDGPRDTRWVDVSGSTEVRDGVLRSTSDGSVTILNGLVDQQAKVRVVARKQLHQLLIEPIATRVS